MMVSNDSTCDGVSVIGHGGLLLSHYYMRNEHIAPPTLWGVPDLIVKSLLTVW